jgi:hypothetical protein
MMSESKFQYLHFCNVGPQTAKLAVLVPRYAQVGLEKDKILQGQLAKQ